MGKWDDFRLTSGFIIIIIIIIIIFLIFNMRMTFLPSALWSYMRL
ncbi:MAG: hypothetical protein K7J15_04795 [Candidatus Regiella insecticola]|nr:hypothetical protein [Candidatus Regiella insecticola]